MAKKQDNMIELIATLDKDKSVKQIESDLKKIAKAINSDKDFSFQIKCSLDQKSLKTMKSELEKIFKNLKISPTAGVTDGSLASTTKGSSKNTKFNKINVIKGETTDETLARAKEELNAQLAGTEDKVTRVTKAYETASGALQRFYVQVERGDKSVATLTYGLDKQAKSFKYLGETIREADNSTDMRRKPLSVQWEIQEEELKKFIANAEKAGVSTTILAEDIAELQRMINAKGEDTNAMNQFLDKLDIAKSKLQAFNAETRKDVFLTGLSNRVKKLSADMDAYAEANSRAVSSMRQMSSGVTFAEKWNQMTTRIRSNAEMTDAEIKELTAEFRIFGKEAEAQGLKGANAFGKFLNSFKVISTYFSASRFITLMISNIRSAIEELKTLNDRLIEISKTSDRTTESLKRLGEASFDIASKYGRTASDYLLGVQEMSRAGFGEVESEKLAELSILAQAAGDMTAEMANEYIIATNAAYNLGGNVTKLNQILDSQNYITNHNAVNMENLAQATKLAASQAAASGVDINELTAAVGTMVATTQQGGDQAGRAFKGILMNIQQVKATAEDIGDGGAEITAESLTKYEKACKALGVSLKGVKNGTLQLREPMAVLEDLAQAVGKESENSIKVANLVSAVGGKFRGNQLVALLKNWETYEKMLSEFSSDKAIGSAFNEAEKSANSWAGSVNKVKNSWSEFVNVFINSDNMIEMLSSVNNILNALTDSAISGGLKKVFDILNKILNVIEFMTKEFGALSVIVTPLIMKYTMLHKLNIFSSIISSLKTIIPLAKTAAVEFNALADAQMLLNADQRSYFGMGASATLGQAVGTGFTTAEKLSYTLSSSDIGTYSTAYSMSMGEIAASSKMAGSAVSGLVASLGTLAIVLGASFLIKKGTELYDKMTIDAEEAARKTREVVASLNELNNAFEELVNDRITLKSILIDYANATFNIENITEKKNALKEVQKSLNEQFGTEAQSIDVINGKYEEQIKNIEEIQRKKEKEFETEHAADIAQARALSNLYIGSDRFDAKHSSRNFSVEGYKPTERFKEDSIEAMYVLDGMDKKAMEIAEHIKGIYVAPIEAIGGIKGFYLSGDIKEARDQLGLLLDEYSKLDSKSQNSKVFQELQNRYDALKEAVVLIEEMQPYLNNEFFSGASSIMEGIASAIKDTSESLQDIIDKSDDLMGNFYEKVEAMENGIDKTVNSIITAIQTIADGDGLSNSDFWSIMELDTEHIVSDIQLIGDKYIVNQEQLIKLKDKYIQEQIDSLKIEIQNFEANKKSLEIEIEKQKAKANSMRLTAMASAENYQQYVEMNRAIKEGEGKLKDYGAVISYNNLLIDYWASKLGDTVDYTEQLKKQQQQLNDELESLNDELDNYQKAFQYIIDSRISAEEKELKRLQEEKDLLQDELDILNEQKSLIEQTIKNYETVNKLVQDTVQKEIEALEEQKQAIEDTYNKRIEALKEENQEREDALEYAQKLANLENAKNNKRYVRDETRGWRYESVKEDVVQAENELKTFETNQAIAAMEKERDAETAIIDKLIEDKEDYAEIWQEMLDEIQTEEDERLAAEILGADWREKIAKGDIEIAKKFRTEYKNHNTALQTLTKTEITLKEEQIKAKDSEIEAAQERINKWKELDTEVSTAVSDIKNANADYLEIVRQLEQEEPLTLDNREQAFDKFTRNVSEYIGRISSKQSEIDNITATLDSIQGGDYKLSFEVEGYDKIIETKNALNEIANSSTKIVVKSAEEIFNILRDSGIWGNVPEGEQMAALLQGIYTGKIQINGLSTGGVVDYTGIAMLHGSESDPELVLNAKDSAKLYNLVHKTPNLMADMMSEANKISGFKLSRNENNSSVNINSINVYANNLQEFDRGLDKHLDQYFRNKLTQNYTNNQ